MIDFDFKDPSDHEPVIVTAYDISPLDPQKRLRVLSGWLMEDVIEDMKLTTFDFHVRTFLKQCDLLEIKYPIHEKHIGEIRIDFWQKAQQKLKLLKEMDRAADKLIRSYQIIQDLKRLRFL